MDDSPEQIAAAIRVELGQDTPILFTLDASSQFYVTFTAWTHPAPNCLHCSAELTLEADLIYRHLGDDGCSIGNAGYWMHEIAQANAEQGASR